MKKNRQIASSFAGSVFERLKFKKTAVFILTVVTVSNGFANDLLKLGTAAFNLVTAPLQIVGANTGGDVSNFLKRNYQGFNGEADAIEAKKQLANAQAELQAAQQREQKVTTELKEARSLLSSEQHRLANLQKAYAARLLDAKNQLASIGLLIEQETLANVEKIRELQNAEELVEESSREFERIASNTSALLQNSDIAATLHDNWLLQAEMRQAILAAKLGDSSAMRELLGALGHSNLYYEEIENSAERIHALNPQAVGIQFKVVFDKLELRLIASGESWRQQQQMFEDLSYSNHSMLQSLNPTN